VLAADNTALCCSTCHREQRDQLRTPPAHLKNEFFETDDLRAAFGSQHIGKVFKAYRNHPRHLQLYGKSLNQELLGRWLGLTQAQVSKLENGKPEQNLDTLRRYAKALHLPQHLLWFDLPGQSRLDPSISTLEVGDDVQRRDFLTGAVAISAMALLPRSITNAAQIGAVDIDDGWRALRRLIELDDTVGGADGYPLAVNMAKQLQTALNRGSFTQKAEHALQELTAATMEHAAWVAYDGGDTVSARRWWLETNHLAEIAGISEPRVATLAAMSLQASTDPARARETLCLANAARAAAGSAATPTLLSVLAAREAVAHAQSGDREAARASISAARNWLDKGRSGREPVVLDFWGAADLACHETRVALAAGDGRSAERAARTAFDSADKDAFPRNHTIYAARLGQILAQTGQIDEAIAVTSDAVEQVDSVRGSRRIIDDLRWTIQLLDAREYRPAQEFAAAARKVLTV